MVDLVPLPDAAICGAFAAAAFLVWLAGKEPPELAARLGTKGPGLDTGKRDKPAHVDDEHQRAVRADPPNRAVRPF